MEKIEIIKYDKIRKIDSVESYNKYKIEIRDLFDSRFNIEYSKVKKEIGKPPKHIRREEEFEFYKFEDLFVGILDDKVISMIKLTNISIFKELEDETEYEERAGISEFNRNMSTGLVSSFCGDIKYSKHLILLSFIISKNKKYDRYILHCVDYLVDYYKKIGFIWLKKIEYGKEILNLMEYIK